MSKQASISKKGKKKEDEIKPLPSKSVFASDYEIYEEIYNKKTNKTEFIGYNTTIDNTRTVKHLGTKTRPIYPLKGDAVKKGVVSLPSGIEEYGTTKQLINDITDFLHKYMDTSKEFRTISAYYILLSWVQDKLHVMPYLKLQGDKGTGKSRVMECVGKLCYKPIKWVNGSPAMTFREMDKWKGTLILEEFIPKRSDDDDVMMQILNAGFERGNPIPRCNGDNNNKGEYFEPFGAKVFGTRKDLTSTAFESRCIKYNTKETTRDDIPILLPPEFYTKQQELRNKLLLWRLKNWHKIDLSIYQKVDLGKNISKRIKQTYLPFVILFYNTPYMQTFKQWVKKANDEQKDIDMDSFDGKIFRGWTNEFLNKGYVTTKNLTLRLHGDYPDSKHYFSERAIGLHLKALGFSRTSKKVNGRVKKEYSIQAGTLKRLLHRYHAEPNDTYTELMKKNKSAIGGGIKK